MNVWPSLLRLKRNFVYTLFLIVATYQATKYHYSSDQLLSVPEIGRRKLPTNSSHYEDSVVVSSDHQSTFRPPSTGINLHDQSQASAASTASNIEALDFKSFQVPSNKVGCWNPIKQCAKTRNRTKDGYTDTAKSQSNASTKAMSWQATRTLALVDPFLRDGYRNQFMRFVSLTTYALKNGFQQMLLPSIRWNCDHRKVKNDAVPFELLFDVDHWNNDTDLPRLVTYSEPEHFDWDPSSGLFRGACDVLDSYLFHGPKRKDIIFNRTRHFQHPFPYGGGMGLGNLFYEYLTNDGRRPKMSLPYQNTSTSFIDIEARITRAMKPSAAVERLIRQTLGGDGQPPHIALHARFEPEMLVHVMCKPLKVYNLTDVFDMIRGMDHRNTTANSSLYIAIGMKEMEEGNKYKWYQAEHRRNMAALYDALSYGLDLPSGNNLTVSVGGHKAIRNDEFDLCAHEILSSVVSFEIAVRAKMFIGTYISSWSQTVWKARHYLGRGENYVYTPKGLEKIEGVPRPFRC